MLANAKIAAVAVALVGPACDRASATPGALSLEAAAPAPSGAVSVLDSPAGEALGTFKLTYYWLADHSRYPGSATHAVYDSACRELATVTPAFAKALALEGTGQLADGRVINVHSACACEHSPCFFEADDAHPWGYGVANRSLTPFRSVAVDRELLSIGQTLYVAELDGVVIPAIASHPQFTHDGCVVADDVGGGITDKHLDLFAGLRAHYVEINANHSLREVTVADGAARCADSIR